MTPPRKADAARVRGAAPRRKPTPEDLLRFVFVSDPRLSPDGKRVLFTRKHVGEKNEYVTDLWQVATQGGAPVPFTSGGKDGHGRWSPDGARIAFTSGRAKPASQLYTIAASGGEARALTRFPEGTISSFKWSPDGRKLAVAFREADGERTEAAAKRRAESGLSEPPRVLDHLLYRLDGDGYFDGRRFALWVVDADGGKARKVFAREQGLGFDYDWSPDSAELAISCNLERDAYRRPWMDRVYRLDLRSERLRALPRQGDGVRSSLAWSPDGGRIAMAGREGRGDIWGSANTHLLIADVESGRTESLTAHEDHCLVAETLSDTREVTFNARLAWFPDGRRIATQIGWHGSSHLASIDARSGKISFLTGGPGQATLGGVSRDGRRIAFLVDSALEPSEVAVGELRGGGARLEVRRLTAFNRALLDELELASPREAWVESTGGTRVHVWSLRPPSLDRPARSRAGRAAVAVRAPAVLMVHGGPHAQYGAAYMHEFQLLAAAGYAVFYGNPRGSKGYGEKHSDAIRGNWGSADWDDVQAIARHVRRQRFVDRERVGIGGGSYGGYMANWAIGHSDQFRAAISDRCVSNLLSMAGTSDFPMAPDQYWTGAPWDRPEALWAQSPIAHFGQVSTPTLVIHSEGDLRCNVEQAEQVFAALQLRGVPSRFVRYPASTSHGMSRGGPPDLRIHRLKEILAWWRKHLR